MSNTQLKSKNVHIRKPRRCWGCTVLFPVGTKMRYEFFIDSGLPGSTYWCEKCQIIVDKIDWSEYEDGLGFGDLRDCPEFNDLKELQK